MTPHQTEVAVVGAGAAGLYTALCAARAGVAVTLISAGPLAGASSYWAQGGLAAALADDDGPDHHLADTLAAGRGSVRESAARVLCDEAPAAVQDLTEVGVTFDADRTGRLALGLEGGHSARRIVHAGGAATGRRIIRRLDMRSVDPALFPNVVTALREAGIDPERELVPVSPAAHYMMGGVATDLHGRASLPGLYAVGECSCTGLHGANRLASNSLSECFVFGARAARVALEEPDAPDAPDAPDTPDTAGAAGTPPAAAISPESRAALWRHAGLERDGEGLSVLLDDPHPLVRLIAAGALARQESRGAHQRRDFPDRSALLDGRHVTITAGSCPTLETWT